MSWLLRFHIPIPLPDGSTLITLRDAGEYIQSLPRATHERPEWKIAFELLIDAVEERGPLRVMLLLMVAVGLVFGLKVRTFD
jgi:hypothetical protein